MSKDKPQGVRAFSSVGRASPLQGEGQKFESSNAQIKGVTLVAPFFINYKGNIIYTGRWRSW